MEKAERLKMLFESEFTSTSIQYTFESDLHKYHILGKPDHWLCVKSDFLDHVEPREVVFKVRDLGVIDLCKSDDTIRWVTVGEQGIEEVDGDSTAIH
ncbi:MAG: hypothetical protein HUJ31_09975 [Pseudomonadales bacterium]|nr:hypothetical protein [Pseudomonadales bacterium]